VGVFVPGKDYKGIARFSTSDTFILPDSKSFTQGMALKLFDVDGVRAWDESRDSSKTQDFLFVPAPYFVTPNNEIYPDLNLASNLGNVASWVLKNFWDIRVLRIMKKIATTLSASKKMENPLDGAWFSATPYSLGRYAVKYIVERIDPQILPSNKSDNDFLRKNTLNDLNEAKKKNREICFNFKIQFQKDPCDDPVEDAAKVWTSTDIVNVAKMCIAHQSFIDKKRFEYCEKLEFNPWHSLKENQPLGEINFARGEIYREVSKNRNNWNKAISSIPEESWTTEKYYDRSCK